VLLLVLILVLIAFGLLVVALLTGSVLWAWVSVGVSVAAAAVLAVDWLQRRSAVKAGAEGGDVAPLPPASPVPPPHMLDREPAVEPATEIIPVVHADDPYPGAPPTGAEAAADDRRDERPDTRETVVMRAFAPSGSAGGPPGAHGGIAPSGQDPSQSVTDEGGPAAGADSPSGPARDLQGAPNAAGAPDADPDSDTVKVAGRDGRDEQVVRADVPPREGADAGGPPPRTDLPPLGPDGAPPEEPRDADAAGLVAGLDDEVLVVDELPRYHLRGCRSLTTSAVIPLPAREAVELGFTPCAWCTPDRALSSRHRAPAR
jgi:hypothetical protein